uniref:Uncharacterized protein n=1 Tax=Arundo donax TaxID=35708 RepID=A0A0A9HF92_ARUDO
MRGATHAQNTAEAAAQIWQPQDSSTSRPCAVPDPICRTCSHMPLPHRIHPPDRPHAENLDYFIKPPNYQSKTITMLVYALHKRQARLITEARTKV